MENANKLPVRRQAKADATVFVVDDDEAVRNSLCFALEIEGFAVRQFESSGDLLAETQFPNRCCLVLDFRLRPDGLAALAALRQRGVQAPAILITSSPGKSVRRRAAAAGVAIIEKPQLGVIVEAIAKALGD